jgi:hypothetical protein
MKISTKLTLQILLILSWIIFVGLCIEAGAFIVNAFFALAKPAALKYLWQEADLSGLYRYDTGHFFSETLTMGIVAMMKAWLFYLIIKILPDKKLNLAQPFSKDVGRFIFNMSYLALLISLFSWLGARYAGWLTKQGVKMPDIQHLQLGGADVWLFMGITLLVIAQIFRKGIEIQTENELTV